jgi:hypothetical protein
MLLVGIWCSVAVWYQAGSEPWRSVLSGATALFAFGCTVALASRLRWVGLGAFAGSFVLFLVWWATISATNIHPGLPMDVRVILAGYLPNYAYDVGATDTSIPFDKLRELSHIDAKAAQADTDPNFSARIREGIPQPH